MSDGFQPPEHLIVTETDDWILNHRVDSALPGYLMLEARAPMSSLAGLSQQALSQLGVLLAKAQGALEAVLAPKHLSIGRYGHSAGYALHFHIVPVCDWVIRGFFADPRHRSLQSLQTDPGGGTDGAELTLYIWREFCEVMERLKPYFTGGAETDPARA
jgi:diadenosine tetraphosphate (Ap4A) HIT family hydrolase